jgi:hypothetical protein
LNLAETLAAKTPRKLAEGCIMPSKVMVEVGQNVPRKVSKYVT